jgi:hypothetical protein
VPVGAGRGGLHVDQRVTHRRVVGVRGPSAERQGRDRGGVRAVALGEHAAAAGDQALAVGRVGREVPRGAAGRRGAGRDVDHRGRAVAAVVGDRHAGAVARQRVAGDAATGLGRRVELLGLLADRAEVVAEDAVGLTGGGGGGPVVQAALEIFARVIDADARRGADGGGAGLGQAAHHDRQLLGRARRALPLGGRERGPPGGAAADVHAVLDVIAGQRQLEQIVTEPVGPVRLEIAEVGRHDHLIARVHDLRRGGGIDRGAGEQPRGAARHIGGDAHAADGDLDLGLADQRLQRGVDHALAGADPAGGERRAAPGAERRIGDRPVDVGGDVAGDPAGLDQHDGERLARRGAVQHLELGLRRGHHQRRAGIDHDVVAGRAAADGERGGSERREEAKEHVGSLAHAWRSRREEPDAATVGVTFATPSASARPVTHDHRAWAIDAPWTASSVWSQSSPRSGCRC